MKWIGLTGGIATGKSAAKRLLLGLGIPVVDADELARFVVEPGQPGLASVVSHFGPEILTPAKTINRQLLGEIIFHSAEKRALLESVLHPLIQIEVQKQKQQFLAAGNEICFYDVPLLFEKHLQNQFFRTVLVWCDEKTQLERLINRNKLTSEQALARIHAQLPLADKLPKADFCIDNSTTLTGLEVQIKSLLKTLIELKN